MTHASCDDVELSAMDNHGLASKSIKNNVSKKMFGEYGCQYKCLIQVEKVSGKVLLQHTGRPDLNTIMDHLTMNSSHSINYFRMGKWFPTMITPLIKVDKTIDEQGKLEIMILLKDFRIRIFSDYSSLN